MLSLSGLKILQMARWMHSDFSQIKVLYNICVSESMKCFERWPMGGVYNYFNELRLFSKPVMYLYIYIYVYIYVPGTEFWQVSKSASIRKSCSFSQIQRIFHSGQVVYGYNFVLILWGLSLGMSTLLQSDDWWQVTFNVVGSFQAFRMLFLPFCVSVCLSLHLLLRRLLAMDDFLFWALPGDELASNAMRNIMLEIVMV